jgi:hypothetical protein
MSVRTLAVAALFLVVGAGMLAHWLGGPAVTVPALACGTAAAAAQLAAARLARRAFDARFTQFIGAWALGVGLRFSGVVLLAAATLAAPAHFPPLPSALAFLGVLIPLLFLELRLTR